MYFIINIKYTYYIACRNNVWNLAYREDFLFTKDKNISFGSRYMQYKYRCTHKHIKQINSFYNSINKYLILKIVS